MRGRDDPEDLATGIAATGGGGGGGGPITTGCGCCCCCCCCCGCLRLTGADCGPGLVDEDTTGAVVAAPLADLGESEAGRRADGGDERRMDCAIPVTRDAINSARN